MSYEKKYILIFDSSLKHERIVVILRVRDMPGELSFFEFGKNDSSSGTSQIWRTTTLKEYLNFDELQLSSHISKLKNDNSPLIPQTQERHDVPDELSFFQFEECQLVKFRFQFCPDYSWQLIIWH
jgi:hypothetical protein